MEKVGIYLLGSWLIVVPFLISLNIYQWLPNGEESVQAKESISVDEQNLFLLVSACGGLGASIHALSSFLVYIGNAKFSSNWSIWYIGRPILGGGVAIAFYFVFRAGFVGFANVKDVGTVNLYGICGISVIVGLFSKEAIEKLKEIAATVFVKPKKQKDALDSSEPKVHRYFPFPLMNPQSGEEIEVFGEGFSKKSVVLIGEAPLPTQFITETFLKATILEPENLGPEPRELSVVADDPGKND